MTMHETVKKAYGEIGAKRQAEIDAMWADVERKRVARLSPSSLRPSAPAEARAEPAQTYRPMSRPASAAAAEAMWAEIVARLNATLPPCAIR
jgi:hypothetical protein